MPLSLEDAELDIVLAAARPLPPELRSEFLEAVAARLEGREVGPGTVHRIAYAVQREFFSPTRGRDGKYFRSERIRSTR